MLVKEREYYSDEIRFIAGTDEAGRGPLAGPVCAAAVVFPPEFRCEEINDSKQLTMKKRESLFRMIEENSLGFGIAMVSASDIDRLNMQRYFYAGLFKRVRSMGITDVLAQLPLIFNNYIHTDMDLTTIAKMLVSFTRIDSANIMLAQTPVFMGVPNVGKTDSFDGYSCVVPDKGSIAELLNAYFRNYIGPVDASELNLVTDSWPHGTASTSANVQFVGQLDKESDDAILSGDTDVAGATTTDGQPASGQ